MGTKSRRNLVPMEARSDAELVQACAQGDRDALRELYHRYSRAVFSWCRRVLRTPEGAIRATESVFVQAFRRANEWTPRVPVAAWLFHLAGQVTGDPAPDPDLYAVYLGVQAATHLAALPLRQAVALRLVRHEHRDIDEAARILGISEDDVRRAVFDGLAALKLALEDQRVQRR